MLLKLVHLAQSTSILHSIAARSGARAAYAAQLSDKALKWLTDNAVIIAEQRSSAVEILRCMSVWLEGAAA